MTVKDLRQLIKGVPGDMPVLIPTSLEFDGVFITPCNGESGVSELGVGDEDTEEIEESFLLVPHGFFDEEDEDAIIPELN